MTEKPVSQSFEERLEEILKDVDACAYNRYHGRSLTGPKQSILGLIKESLPVKTEGKFGGTWNEYHSELLNRWGMEKK